MDLILKILIVIAVTLVLLAAIGAGLEKHPPEAQAPQPPPKKHWMEIANERFREEKRQAEQLAEQTQRREEREREHDRKYRAAGTAMSEGRDVCLECLAIEPSRCYHGVCLSHTSCSSCDD